MSNCRQIRSLVRDHVPRLLYLFSELNDDIMDTVNNGNPILQPLEVINVDVASSSHVGRITKLSNINRDTFIMFGKEYLQCKEHGIYQ